MSSVKHAIKVGVAHILYATGALRLLLALMLRRRAVVLMYHRVLGPEEQARTASHPGIIVTRETFAAHMAVLRRYFDVLSVEEFTRRLEQRIPFESCSCLITFDDGWQDNHRHALPVLREHRFPSLVFLPVNFIGGCRPFWQEALTRLLIKARHAVAQDERRRGAIRARLAPMKLEHVLECSENDLRSAVLAGVGATKHARPNDVHALIETLACDLGMDREALSEVDTFLSWDQVSEMKAHGVVFGGHGAEHYLLTNVTADEAEREIRTAREVVERRAAPPVLTFSYPNGSWAESIAATVRRNGFRLAFTTEPGWVGCTDDPLTLRRVNIHEDATASHAMFLSRVLGLF